MQDIYNWRKLSWIEVEPGVRRKVIQAETCTIALVELSPDAPIGMHSHPHEQFSTIQGGNAEFILGRESYPVGPGDVIRIPPDLKHGVRVLGDTPVTLLDFFTPKRKDFTASQTV